MADFALGEAVDELRAEVLRFGDRDLAPRVRDFEQDRRWPKDVLAVLDGFSLSALDLPEDLGGVGAGSLAKVVALEAVASGDPGGLPAADQPGDAAGALIACPDRELAARVGAECLSGQAQCAISFDDARVAWAPSWPPLRWVFTCTDDELRTYEVDEPPSDDVLALGFHACGGTSLTLGDERAPTAAWPLSPLEALSVRGRARLWSAAVAVGIAQAAFDATIAYTTDRIVFGKAVAHHQGNAFELAAAAARVAAARHLVHDAARRFDVSDRYAGFWATQAWLETMDAAHVVTDLGIQLLGGHGFLNDHLAEKRFREARMIASMRGGRDAANNDVAMHALDVPDDIFHIRTA